MNKYYATLCLGDGGGYVTILAPDREDARQKMFQSKYGRNWAFMYDEAEKPQAIERFNLQERDVLC